MATELSDRQAFDLLSASLKQENLGWIIGQVEEQIRLGKPVIRRVKELRLSRRSSEATSRFPTDEKMEPGRAVEYRGTVDYTDAEQLRLLLSAIRCAIVSTSAVAEVVTQRFPGITFVSEQTNHRFTASDLGQEDRTRAVNQLERTIAQIVAG